MTIFEAYVNGQLHPSVTRRGIIFRCELYALFIEARKEMKYEEAIYMVAEKKSASPHTVEAAIRTAKKPV